MGELWSGLTRTLGRLDRLAADPDGLDSDRASQSLRRLQYALHVASEHTVGVEPPAGSASAHAELVAALTHARDATSRVAEAIVDWSSGGVEPHLHEWRGALFRVRLARLRLATPAADAQPAVEETRGEVWRPLLAFLLALFGAVAFVAGATLGIAFVWAAGLVAVICSVVSYRP
jgi:hypothetical protein